MKLSALGAILSGMESRSPVTIHQPVKGTCAECGAPLKWAEKTLPRDRNAASEIALVCRNNHRVVDALAIASLAATLFGNWF